MYLYAQKIRSKTDIFRKGEDRICFGRSPILSLTSILIDWYTSREFQQNITT